MKIEAVKELETRSKMLVLGFFKEEKEPFKETNPELFQEIKSAEETKRLTRDFGKICVARFKESIYDSILVISLGEQKKFDAEKLRRAMSVAVSVSKSRKSESFITNIPSISGLNAEEAGRASAEGIILANYEFKKYKNNGKDSFAINVCSLVWTDIKSLDAFKKGIKTGTTIGNSTNFARDLINEPASVATPSYLEKQAKSLVTKNLSVKVLNQKNLEKLGLGAFLAVAKGSDEPPKLILLHYKNQGPLTAIVGKGITFDSGGYHVKPFGYMEDMKSDMSGAAAVLGTMKAISELGLKKNVLGVIPSCENMISGHAYRPGDILKAFNGKTIEIANTDAEGRLILADALSYTEKIYKPSIMVDIATLTGACMIALGPYASGLIGRDEQLLSEIEKAGNKSYDRVWRLPFFEDFDDSMDAEIADLSNLSGKHKSNAGATTAGIFLSKFVEKARWAHIDIAGTAFPKEASYYNKKNSGDGAGVRLLTYWLMN